MIWKSRDSGSESNGSSSASEKYSHRHTQECYRYYKVGHIAWYCLSTALVESTGQTETAAVAATTTMTTTSIENYWTTVTHGESPSTESWYLHCATTSHSCSDRRKFEWYTEYTKREEREICKFAGRVAGKAIGYGNVRLRLRLPGYGRYHEVVVRDIVHIKGAHNSLSQSRLMHWGLQIVSVHGYGIKIYDNLQTESAQSQIQDQGRGNLAGMSPQFGGLFWLDLKFAGKRCCARG